jgi:protocatechuate 3,4-dioxygenase alpha subunit
VSAERGRARANYDVYLGQTPGQTLGPFFQQGLLRTGAVFQVPGLCNDASDVFDHVLVQPTTFGERIAIEGCVYDGLEQPIGDALIELWQANAYGRYGHPLDTSGRELDPAFRGYGRAATDAQGGFGFRSIKPGPVAGPGGSTQAPHLNLVLGARGMSRHAFTRVYFESDARLEQDPILSLVPERRRPTLLARAVGQRDGAALYRFDIHLQGENETVFFEF